MTISTQSSPTAGIDWEAALHHNESWLRTVIAVRVGESAAVEEVWQEVSLAAIRQRSPLQDVTRITPWLYQLAVRQSLLYRRKMGRRRKLVERYIDKIVPTREKQTAQTPLDILLTNERHQQVRVAMKSLEEEDREVLLLKYTHDWSYRDLAEKLGLSITAVQARLHRARKRLREKLVQSEE
ncbi:MAG: RNA polymerase sigma factor [Planctomycetaceae bacterium]|nr:RNA polymerase sigma factor [Planctomycetaceae bacterium]